MLLFVFDVCTYNIDCNVIVLFQFVQVLMNFY